MYSGNSTLIFLVMAGSVEKFWDDETFRYKGYSYKEVQDACREIDIANERLDAIRVYKEGGGHAA